MLKTAWTEQRVLRIRYRKWRAAAEVRDIEVYAYDEQYIAAYCRLRQDPRTFRIDRIVGAMLLEERFVIDPAIESIIESQGWVNRSPEWRRSQMQSIRMDKICDRLLT